MVLLQGINQMPAKYNWSVTIINILCPLSIDRGPTKFILILLNQLSRIGRDYIKESELDIMSGNPQDYINIGLGFFLKSSSYVYIQSILLKQEDIFYLIMYNIKIIRENLSRIFLYF